MGELDLCMRVGYAASFVSICVWTMGTGWAFGLDGSPVGEGKQYPCLDSHFSQVAFGGKLLQCRLEQSRRL